MTLYITLFVFLFLGENIFANGNKAKDAGYPYESVEGDMLKVRIYTLDNGLKVYLTVNKDEPRMQTAIAVKAGSTFDPAENTGLAHYLEHMMFKGTDVIGTLDWEKEELLLKKVSDLFEQHLQTNDPKEKLEIYQLIDSFSQLASKLAIANEYDKMISSIGAKGTNAFTSNEQTVYINNIPSNELEKWLMIESERFSKLVLRLFHTELETVYEEFNRTQDSDGRKVNRAMNSGLYKIHQYGTQTTIGTSEHLKNPSMERIHAYFDKYYVPNNMAICISGDFDPDITIALIDKYFGNFKREEITALDRIIEEPLTGITEKEVFGPDRKNVNIGFRFSGINTRDEYIVTIIDMILNNSQAGLMDLDLVQAQKVLNAGSYPHFHKEYGAHRMYGIPRENQSLEEVRDLILSMINRIKEGDFEDWLLEAVVNDLKLSRIKGYESNRRVYDLVDAFIFDIPWNDHVKKLDVLAKISKEEIIEFANKHYNNNYVVVYKRTGKDETVAKVDKPPITPIKVNREDQSGFVKDFNKISSVALSPVFLSYKTAIKEMHTISGLAVSYIHNDVNKTFNLYYILDMGTDNDLKMGLAIKYLKYLGSKKYEAKELQQEFYRLGLSFSVSSSRDRIYISLSGLSDSYNEGIELFEHVLSSIIPNDDALNDMIDGILKSRADAKLNKRTILRSALANYAKYNVNSPFLNRLSEEELRAITSKELVTLIKKITKYKHRIFYYGSHGQLEVLKGINDHHVTPKRFLANPLSNTFVEQDNKKNVVYFVNYDMVQAEILFLSKDEKYDASLQPYAILYNEYFGSGLSSIVFQEIREAKGLAYSAYSFFSIPSNDYEYHYLNAYLGVQADKMKEAVKAMLEILNDMPEAEKQFAGAVESVRKKIESERITKASIFWNYERAKRRGLSHDIRKDVYAKMEDASLQELLAFFEDHIKGKHFTFLVIGNKDDLDMDALNALGEFRELTLEEIFGY